MQPMPKREVKKIYFDDEAREKLLRGAGQMARAVGKTYGPSGTNVILGMPYGDATQTRDGVTVAKRTILEDRAEDYAAQILRQASEKTNKSAGDGTTATIVLGENLFRQGAHMIAAGDNPMLLKRQLLSDAAKILSFVREKSTDVKDHLYEVATVSAGDENIGRLVADTISDMGSGGGITIREQNYPVIEVEKVNGYYFDKGFFALNREVEYAAPYIFVSQKQISTNNDIVPIISAALGSDNKKLVIIGEVRQNSEAMNTLFLNLVKKAPEGFEAIVVPPPVFGDEGKLFMEDIATYVGAKLFLPGDDPKSITLRDLGKAERVQCSQDRAVIFRGAGDGNAITDRAAEIRETADKETSAHRKDQLEQRFSKLTGKVAIINVGGSTPIEMEELRYRVEDAVEAAKSAIADGILPGGATLLVKSSQLPKLSSIFVSALRDTFEKLMNNAAEDASYRFKQVQSAGFGFGFNLRAMSDEPVDLREAGIWDATRAIVQTIENATSAACTLLTGETIISPVEQHGAE